MFEDELHARYIVEDERDDESRRIGEKDVEVGSVMEQVHDSEVNDGGNDADHAKLDVYKRQEDVRAVGEQLAQVGDEFAGEVDLG